MSARDLIPLSAPRWPRLGYAPILERPLVLSQRLDLFHIPSLHSVAFAQKEIHVTNKSSKECIHAIDKDTRGTRGSF